MAERGRYIPVDQKLAAVISLLLPKAEREELRARKACATEVQARYHFHHIKYFSWGGSNRWWNLELMTKAEHLERTKTDIGTIAKSKRIQRKEAEHKLTRSQDALMRWYDAGCPTPPPTPPLGVYPPGFEAMRAEVMRRKAGQGGKARKIPSRPFSKTKRKLRNKK